MIYPDTDYINDILFYISELSYHIRKRKFLNEEVAQEMITLTIDLLTLLQLYIDDKYIY